MKMDVSREEVWAASIEDRPGSLQEKLQVLAEAGVDLEFVIARRCPDKPGEAVVFVTPIQGAKQIRAARQIGFEKTKSLHGVRVCVANKAGVGAKLTHMLAEAGINLRGLSAAAIGNRAVFHLAFDSGKDAGKAIRVLQQR